MRAPVKFSEPLPCPYTWPNVASTFRATGITGYLRNGGKLEVAQAMANHESARTTGLYDGRQDEISLDEIERILI